MTELRWMDWRGAHVARALVFVCTLVLWVWYGSSFQVFLVEPGLGRPHPAIRLVPAFWSLVPSRGD